VYTGLSSDTPHDAFRLGDELVDVQVEFPGDLLGLLANVQISSGLDCRQSSRCRRSSHHFAAAISPSWTARMRAATQRTSAEVPQLLRSDSGLTPTPHRVVVVQLSSSVNSRHKATEAVTRS